MSAGHILPGFGNPVSKFHRVKAEPEFGSQALKDKIDLTNAGSNYEFEEIRQRARDVWAQSDREATTYGSFFDDKSQQVDEWTSNRPTSSDRKHNPHPPHVFLQTRMKHIPGYHNPGAARTKPKQDPSLPAVDRASKHGRFTPQLSDSVMQRFHNDINYDVMDLDDAKMQMVGKDDQDDILGVNHTERGSPSKSWQNPLAPQHNRPSVHRYLKVAGKRESDALNHYRQPNKYGMPGTYGGYTAPVDKFPQKQNGDYHRQHCSTYQHNNSTNPVMDHTKWRSQPPWGRTNINDPNSKALETIGSARHLDRKNIGRAAGVTLQHPRAVRGDYLMHPDWPPTIPHHRLPCLC